MDENYWSNCDYSRDVTRQAWVRNGYIREIKVRNGFFPDIFAPQILEFSLKIYVCRRCFDLLYIVYVPSLDFST